MVWCSACNWGSQLLTFTHTHTHHHHHHHLPFQTPHTHQLLLSTASPKPGVSTTVSLSFTPFSSMSTVVASMLTVCFIRSVECESACVCWYDKCVVCEGQGGRRKARRIGKGRRKRKGRRGREKKEGGGGGRGRGGPGGGDGGDNMPNMVSF